MNNAKCLFVEKKTGFDVESKDLLNDFKNNLGINNLENVRVINKYIIKNIRDKDYEISKNNIFSEPTVDKIYENSLKLNENDVCFGVEYLTGQYNQRADSAEQCINLISSDSKNVAVKSQKFIILQGNLNHNDIDKIKRYYINPVDSREVDIYDNSFDEILNVPKNVETIDGFIDFSNQQLNQFHKTQKLSISIDDLTMVFEYFKYIEKRCPTITEIKVIDTYWSDHCRHTTFLTNIKNIEFEKSDLTKPIIESYNDYLSSREFVYINKQKPICLMDIAVICMKEMRKKGILNDLDVSEEINACSINIDVETDNGIEKYLLMFKNETHNHPTEIEPFGGAATCLGGAIRDPLSGRTYVYQSMRVSGAGDPTVNINNTLDGKLPQRTITIGAASGYSSYGNQIGLATGQVSEVYHPNYVAKRMEVGAVIAAAPKENVIREKPDLGDVIILLGGRTGRDGIGGATGSSKQHTTESINECGAEVQKGNAPTERKIQRLFRNKRAAQLIKRCNDFGAGGVSVAIGELCSGVYINLDKVLKKYNGLDGTELAISESQERMAVVVDEKFAQQFINLANQENLEAVIVAKVTDDDRLKMQWNGQEIVNLSRDFLDTNGAKQYIDITVKSPAKYPFEIKDIDVSKKWIETLDNLNVCSQQGLVDRFDSTIGARTVLMPFGGKYQKTPSEGMAAKIPVLDGESKDASIMTYGFNPYLGEWSPYHMAFYSVIESITKLACIGGDYKKARLTFQEYFENLGKNSEKWGKPFSALLGAYKVQKDLGIPAIGGKDSMSGTFGDIDVPPSLISFAVCCEKADNIISNEFKKVNSKIILLQTNVLDDYTIDMNKFKTNLNVLHNLILSKKVLSACSVKFGGVCEALTKMSLGNKIGVDFENLNNQDLFGFNYGSIIIEVSEDFNIQDLKYCSYKLIGKTIDKNKIMSSELNIDFDIDYLQQVLENKLSGVFKLKTDNKNKNVKTTLYNDRERTKSKFTVDKPKVVIPVFPGTNCEEDCERAFRKYGADVKQVLIKNLNSDMLKNSVDQLEKEIRQSQIIMIPGGFSAGDEPDGSAKFIASLFRNPKIKDAVTDLIENRDGLILGICNGFQALIKLGLVPYGKILDINEDMPTLTYNNINKHMSSLIKTRITSVKSPWFANVNTEDIHTVAISHGEGRFVASDDVIKQLEKNGQIATQYVDNNNDVTLDMPYNPNGSDFGIEGITSPDGRILSKMGHSERIGDNLYKNVLGEYEQHIFKSGVEYFKK